MKIELIKKVNRNEVIRLYKDAGWWEPEYDENLAFIEHIAVDSFLFAGVFDNNNQLVGMGRVLSDGYSDAYIQDVVVLSSYRKQGLGREIIRFLISELKKHGIDWIGLIAEPGTSDFYENLGFKVMKDHVPMKLDN